ncbi:MAG TPA: transposase family protein [Urbifossiella sp.]|nr:transposase family protein [Urbifossiella sp.]
MHPAFTFCRCDDAKKNSLRQLRIFLAEFLRPRRSPVTRSGLRRPFRPPGVRVPPHPLSAVRRETRTPRLARHQPRYTRRFVIAVGRRCRTATIKDVAQEMDLHWETVKEIDKLYMQEQLDRAGPADRRVAWLAPSARSRWS